MQTPRKEETECEDICIAKKPSSHVPISAYVLIIGVPFVEEKGHERIRLSLTTAGPYV
jgi:hypothetical protein